MSSWLRLFLSPSGQIGRRAFLHGVIVIQFVNILLVWGSVVLNAAVVGLAGQKLILLPLVTLYPTICVFSKRLRDVERRVWLQAPSRLLLTTGLGVLAFNSLWTSSVVMASWVFISIPLGLLADVGLTIWLGFAATKRLPETGLTAFD